MMRYLLILVLVGIGYGMPQAHMPGSAYPVNSHCVFALDCGSGSTDFRDISPYGATFTVTGSPVTVSSPGGWVPAGRGIQFSGTSGTDPCVHVADGGDPNRFNLGSYGAVFCVQRNANVGGAWANVSRTYFSNTNGQKSYVMIGGSASGQPKWKSSNDSISYNVDQTLGSATFSVSIGQVVWRNGGSVYCASNANAGAVLPMSIRTTLTPADPTIFAVSGGDLTLGDNEDTDNPSGLNAHLFHVRVWKGWAPWWIKAKGSTNINRR
jgi:hypothetical protein